MNIATKGPAYYRGAFNFHMQGYGQENPYRGPVAAAQWEAGYNDAAHGLVDRTLARRQTLESMNRALVRMRARRLLQRIEDQARELG